MEKMNYLRAALSETLRLYPAVPLVRRETLKNYHNFFNFSKEIDAFIQKGNPMNLQFFTIISLTMVSFSPFSRIAKCASQTIGFPTDLT